MKSPEIIEMKEKKRKTEEKFKKVPKNVMLSSTNSEKEKKQFLEI